MSLNDYYYTEAKQRAAELQARAAEERLAKIARDAAKQQRAARREARRLQVAVEGRRSLGQALRSLFVAEGPEPSDPVAPGQADETTAADRPTRAAILARPRNC